MAGLKLNHIYKIYDNGVKAVNDFTMDIEDKEFIVIVGPSGCGKSTILRMIAGLEEITAGELTIGETIMNDVEPKDRDIAMVFQNYALYPHMTVYKNMSYALKIRKVPKSEIDKRVRNAAEILGITEYLNRKPKAMSGGQRQRVALGRAIVREPKVFLLDEPLSNLDAKLRTSMRTEIAKLHKKLQTTFIYVTHDQVEAMTLGTRVVVMKDGFIRQIDSPRNLYKFPQDKFVAEFIGTPPMNFFKVTLKKQNDKVLIKFIGTDTACLVDYIYFAKADKKYLDGEKTVLLGIRAEHIHTKTKSQIMVPCLMNTIEELGKDNQAYGDINLTVEDMKNDSPTRIIFQLAADEFYNYGQEIQLSFEEDKIHLFDIDTEKTIAPRRPMYTYVTADVAEGELNILGGTIRLPPAVALKNGKYDVCISAQAVSKGRQFSATFISDEYINGTRTAMLSVDGNYIFLPVSDGEEISGIDIDVTYCTFEQGGEIIAEALPETTCLAAIYKCEKTKEKTQDTKLNKNTRGKYYFSVEEQNIPCSEQISSLIRSRVGKALNNSTILIEVTPSAFVLSTEGISAEVERILDYGKKKIARCHVGGSTINVAVPDDFSSDVVKFTINENAIAIYDEEHDIRFV